MGWADVATKRDLDQGFEALEYKLLAAFRGELLNAIFPGQRPRRYPAGVSGRGALAAEPRAWSAG